MNESWQATNPPIPELPEIIRRVLAENGISGNHDGLHGWRCAHPDRYGECCCVNDLIGELVDEIEKAAK